MKANRWPALIVIPLLVLAMVAIEQVGDGPVPTRPLGPDEVESTPASADPGMPIAAGPDDAGSTWYCPSATGGGNSQFGTSVLVLANASDVSRSGTVSVFGAGGPAGSIDVEVPAATRWQIDLAELSDEARLAALVELDGGGVAAAVVTSGSVGSDVSPCLSEPSGSWVIPAAATTLDARAVLVLFNPFPDDAVLEMSFVADDEVRVPTGFEGFPVPASSVVAVDLTEIVTVRPQFATVMTSRTGQVVAAMVQTYDGSEATEGLSVLNGATAPAETWFFPGGRGESRVEETFVVMNPGDTEALLDVSVSLDDPDQNGTVLPIEITVPAHRYTSFSSTGDSWSRVPPGVSHSVAIRSQNGVPVVSAQLLRFSGDERAPGFASSLGAPLEARTWIVPVADLKYGSTAVAAVNPSPLQAALTRWEAFGSGRRDPLDDATLGEGRRALRPTPDDLGLSPSGLIVRADVPVVVSSAYSFDEGDNGWMIAIPVDGTTVEPDPIEVG